nr:MAG TPA: hypothetical protein [Caudoviricetes sp.]
MTDFKPFNWDYFFDGQVNNFRKLATEYDNGPACKFANKTETARARGKMESKFHVFQELYWDNTEGQYTIAAQDCSLTWFHRITPRAWLGLDVAFRASCDRSSLVKEYRLDSPEPNKWVQFVFSYKLEFCFNPDWVSRLLHQVDGIPPLMRSAVSKLRWKADCPSAYEVTLPAVNDIQFEQSTAYAITKGFESIIDDQVEEFFKFCDLNRYTDAMKEHKTKAYGAW